MIELENLIQINTEQHEMSPFFVGDSLVFVKFEQQSRKDKPKRGEQKFDLYKSVRVGDDFSETTLLDDRINSEYVEGPGVYDEIAGIIYFTRSRRIEDKKRKERKVNHLGIYASQKRDGGWSEPAPLPFLLDDFNFCHPSLMDEGRRMIFASDMPGGFGKMDLYESRYFNGEWSKPLNLGARINTSENEIFPTAYLDMLFYSHDTEGQLDIYGANMTNNNDPEALPVPINSDHDDFSLIIDEEEKTGFISSNRPGGAGTDDLYRLSFPLDFFHKNPYAKTINVLVLDKLSLQPIENAEISLTNINLTDDQLMDMLSSDIMISDQDELVLTLKTPEEDLAYLPVAGEGSVFVEVDNRKLYLVKTKAKDYDPNTTILRMSDDLTEYTVLLSPKVQSPIEVLPPPPTIIQNDIEISLSEGTTLVFDNIYYNYNSAEIKSGAAQELDVLAQVMLENLSLRVRLSSHTDARGNAAYNQTLSEKRALSAKKYLMQKGIASSRMQTVGYGETQIRNQCKEGIKCTAEEHAYNRRTEVTVIE